MTPRTEDLSTIPAFLLRTPERQAAIIEHNRAHPLPAVDFSGETNETRREVDVEQERFREEARLAKNAATASARARKKMEDEQAVDGKQVFDRQVPGTVWDPGTSRWVQPNRMTRAKFQRLLGEMPNDKARDILIETYGAGLAGASPAEPAGTLPNGGRKARADQPGTRSEAGEKPAGRVRVTAAPPAKEKPAAPAKARRGGKPEIVASVEAMLTRPEGATLAEIGAAHGWKEHSASAFVSVNFRNAGRRTTKESVEGRGAVYHLEVES